MKLSNAMTAAINDQIKAEFDSAYIYLAMSAYFEDLGLTGMAHWMQKQYKEEIEHAEKFIAYLYERGARVVIPDIAKPKDSYPSALEVFKEALHHEEYVTERIYKLVDQALAEKDYATLSMLKWYVDEQVEEENSTGAIVSRLEALGESKPALCMLDKELAGR